MISMANRPLYRPLSSSVSRNAILFYAFVIFPIMSNAISFNVVKKVTHGCEILGSHGFEYGDGCLLGCCAVQLRSVFSGHRLDDADSKHF
jgi:hypothetical protein